MADTRCVQEKVADALGVRRDVVDDVVHEFVFGDFEGLDISDDTDIVALAKACAQSREVVRQILIALDELAGESAPR
jgi:hypothetical protein